MRTIVHVDLDAFFAAVEALRHPEYRGKPIVVGADPATGRGVVATCSYEARAYGIRSAMPIAEAYRRCPHAVYLRPDMRCYERYSRAFHDSLLQFSPVVEPLSIDEAFIDMTGCEHFYPSSQAMARAIQKSIYETCELKASVGVAPNKFLAKLASDRAKPNGIAVIRPDDIRAFLDPMPIEQLWGVGPKTALRLRQVGFRRVRDLLGVSPEGLAARVGPSTAAHLLQLAQGIDDRPVEPRSEAKSISREITFDRDVTDFSLIRPTMARLVADVGVRLRKSGFWAGKVFIKVRYSDFTTLTRQTTCRPPIQSDDPIFDAAYSLWSSLKSRRPIRLIGVGVGELTQIKQESLFGEHQRSDHISETIDRINDKLGARLLRRGREWTAN